MTHDFNLRDDLKPLAELVPQGASVLDVGCGNGELLAWLVKHKQVKGRGLELQQERVNQSIAKGLAVVQGNAETDLDYYLQGAFDVVILSRTLQAMQNPVAVLQQVIRIGKRAIVAIPNFGHWRNRFYLSWYGRMPVTRALSYAWYDTPNIHFCTLRDFEILCQEQQIRVMERRYTAGHPLAKVFIGCKATTNLLAEQGIFMIEKSEQPTHNA